jgi:hypothetical protein
MIKWICIASMTLLLGGCAALAPLAAPLLPNGSASAEFRTATTVKLEQENFIVVKTNVVGRCKGFSLLGIITIVPARFDTAMDRLYGQAEMQPGRSQTLASLVMERSTTYWILYSVPRVSIRADVVEFVPPSPSGPSPAPPGGTRSALSVP